MITELRKLALKGTMSKPPKEVKEAHEGACALQTLLQYLIWDRKRKISMGRKPWNLGDYLSKSNKKIDAL